jgi:hypothetical protein
MIIKAVLVAAYINNFLAEPVEVIKFRLLQKWITPRDLKVANSAHILLINQVMKYLIVSDS